jgi:hypothetical protein
MSDPRQELLGLLLGNQRRIDRQRRELARRVVAGLEQSIRGRGQFDVMAHALTMREVDRVFDDYYGRFPGDESARFLHVILEGARRAWIVALRRQQQAISALLRDSPGLLPAIRARLREDR